VVVRIVFGVPADKLRQRQAEAVGQRRDVHPGKVDAGLPAAVAAAGAIDPPFHVFGQDAEGAAGLRVSFQVAAEVKVLRLLRRSEAAEFGEVRDHAPAYRLFSSVDFQDPLRAWAPRTISVVCLPLAQMPASEAAGRQNTYFSPN
jgi:hypothetical protein